MSHERPDDIDELLPRLLASAEVTGLFPQPCPPESLPLLPLPAEDTARVDAESARLEETLAPAFTARRAPRPPV